MDNKISISHKPIVFIYIPGFPGEAIPRELDEIRVVDIAKNIIEKQGHIFKIVQYPGILDQEEFSFKKTQQETFKLIERSIDEGLTVKLIGHSWGGALALLASSHYSVDQILLITPFLLIPKDDILLETLKYYSQAFPEIIPKAKILNRVSEIDLIRKELLLIESKSILAKKLLILACNNDDIVSFDLLKKYLSTNLPTLVPNLQEINNDHDFTFGKEELSKWLTLYV